MAMAIIALWPQCSALVISLAMTKIGYTKVSHRPSPTPSHPGIVLLGTALHETFGLAMDHLVGYGLGQPVGVPPHSAPSPFE